MFNREYKCESTCTFRKDGVITEQSFITNKDFNNNFSEDKTIFERFASENIYIQISLYMANLILGYIVLSIFKRIMRKCIKLCHKKRKRKYNIEMIVVNEENRPMVRPARNQRRIQFNPTAP